MVASGNKNLQENMLFLYDPVRISHDYLFAIGATKYKYSGFANGVVSGKIAGKGLYIITLHSTFAYDSFVINRNFKLEWGKFVGICSEVIVDERNILR